jgi:hypothetical protein
MLALRIFGGVFAAALLVGSVLRYRRRQISRLNLIISWTISLGIILLAAFPNLFDPFFRALNFQRGGGQRLTGALLIAVVILLALLIRLTSYVDTNQRSIRQLVESLAVQTFDWSAAERLEPGKRIVVVSPAHNEEENVGAVIRAMPREIDGFPVLPIVVDDGSEDRTAEVAEAAGALVARLPIQRGGGLALRVGYQIALQLSAEVVVSLDSDGQHLPEEMEVVVKPVLAGDADMVNGSRLLGEFERESLVRHVGVHFFSRLVTLMTGQRVTDVSSGYRATRADVLRKLVLEQDQFWTSELLIEALRHRARIREVPITIKARAGGKSKKPKPLKYGWHFAKAIIQTWLR